MSKKKTWREQPNTNHVYSHLIYVSPYTCMPYDVICQRKRHEESSHQTPVVGRPPSVLPCKHRNFCPLRYTPCSGKTNKHIHQKQTNNLFTKCHTPWQYICPRHSFTSYHFYQLLRYSLFTVTTKSRHLAFMVKKPQGDWVEGGLLMGWWLFQAIEHHTFNLIDCNDPVIFRYWWELQCHQLIPTAWHTSNMVWCHARGRSSY